MSPTPGSGGRGSFMESRAGPRKGSWNALANDSGPPRPGGNPRFSRRTKTCALRSGPFRARICTGDAMQLTGLFTYPVKSLRGCAVHEAQVDELGLVGDRRFLVVDEAG